MPLNSTFNTWLDGKDKRPELWQLALAGGAAGGINSLVLTPIELVRNRLQIATGNRDGGFAVLRQVLAQGMRSPPSSLASSPVVMPVVVQTMRTLWRGLPATLCRDIPGVSAYYLFFEVANRRLAKRKQAEEERMSADRARESANDTSREPRSVKSGGGSDGASKTLRTLELAAAGALGGCGYWFVALPFDAAKSVMQTAAAPQPLLPTLRTLLREGGLARLYVGLTSALLRGIPGAAVVFTTYGTVLAYLEQADAQR